MGVGGARWRVSVGSCAGCTHRGLLGGLLGGDYVIGEEGGRGCRLLRLLVGGGSSSSSGSSRGVGVAVQPRRVAVRIRRPRRRIQLLKASNSH